MRAFDVIQTNLSMFRLHTENNLKQSSTTGASPLFTQEQVEEEPTTASILSVIGGVLLAFGGLFETTNFGTIGFFIGSTSYVLTDQDRLTLGIFGIVFGAVMIGSGYMLHSHPEEHAPWGVIVLILSGLSVFTSLGGMIIGFFLGGLGGIKAIRWKRKPTTLKFDSGIWESYAGEVITELNTIPGESDRVFAIYEKSGLDGIVSYLKQKDPDLTSAEALPVATQILIEIDLRRKQNEEKQKSFRPTESPVQAGTNAALSERETNTAQVDKPEKSWIDKWLKR